MSKKMLIDASQPEETRVVVVDGTRVEELDFESASKRQLRGNVYLARVTRVEPSLQAAFVEYGGNRHGFLAFSEIHPDYYQIPYEDRMALIEAEEAKNLEEEEEVENELDAESEDEDSSEDEDNEDDLSSEDAESEPPVLLEADNGEDAEDYDVEDEIEKTASTRRSQVSHRRYKIQEVIKRGQILLIQVVKEERGNKGAAMTTYLSLAGRYCVLMPNTPRGGGISRKIANSSDRKRLKAIVSEFDVPQGMGVIIRTAGAKRTKAEIKRDFDYLSRLWETIRTTTLTSIAPSLIYEEGDLVKRSIRDLYNKDIDEILVQGDDAYKTAKDFIKMLMPSHAKNVKAYKDQIPLFLRYNVEKQIEQSLEPIVQLKSGGYLVIHPTEALVSVDVNSGRSTKERNVERTALKTNQEAADEVARQMRLRDLAGLIVIDFIDMEENRNNRMVERRMKEVLSKDRARVQAGRISQFGLMEISRQRRRRSLLEGSTVTCPHCNGVGRERTIESYSLKILRAIEEMAVRRQAKRIQLTVSPEIGTYLLNHKRTELNVMETEFDTFVEIELEESRLRLDYEIEILEKPAKNVKDPLIKIEQDIQRESQKSKSSKKSKATEEFDDDDDIENDESARKDDTAETRGKSDQAEGEPRKRRRRGRRGGRRRRSEGEHKSADTQVSADIVEVEVKDGTAEVVSDTEIEVTTVNGQTKKSATKGKGTKSRAKAPAKNQDDQTKAAKGRRSKKAPAPSKSDEVPTATADEAVIAPSAAKSDSKKSSEAAGKKQKSSKAAEKTAKVDAKPKAATASAKSDNQKTPETKKAARTTKSSTRKKAPPKRAKSVENQSAPSADQKKQDDTKSAPPEKAGKAVVATRSTSRRKAPPRSTDLQTEDVVQLKEKPPAKPAKPKKQAAKKAEPVTASLEVKASKAKVSEPDAAKSTRAGWWQRRK